MAERSIPEWTKALLKNPPTDRPHLLEALVVKQRPDEAQELLANLVRLRRYADEVEPPIEEQGEAAFKAWAYEMSDAWQAAFAFVDRNCQSERVSNGHG